MSKLFVGMTMATVLVLGTSLAAWAEEAVDHAALAAQYEQEAKDAQAKVQTHKAMEKRYGGVQYSKVNRIDTMRNHCKRLIAEYERIAADAEALAKEHREAATASHSAH